MKQLQNGIYRQGDSVIHRLDATVKLISFIILCVAIVSADSPCGYAIIIGFTVLIAVISKIGIIAAIGSIRKMKCFFAVVFIMNLFFYKTDNAWVDFWIFTPSYDGMMQGIKVVVRVAVFLVLSNILSAATPPVSITHAIENIISPLKFIKIPVEQLALILSVAIQFIPTLFEETDMIKKAQTARGASFDSRAVKGRAAAVMPLIVPMFIAAFRRADELSLAMEARGYRVDGVRSRKRKINFSFFEISALLLCTLILVLQIILFYCFR